MRFGSSMLTLGALVRGLSTFPAYEDRMEPHTKFAVVEEEYEEQLRLKVEGVCAPPTCILIKYI